MSKSKRASKSSSLTKSQLCSLIAEDVKLKKSEVEAVFLALFDIVKKELSKGATVTIPNLAKVKLHRRPATAAREGINPFTKAKMTIPAKPARNVVKVRPIKQLKELA